MHPHLALIKHSDTKLNAPERMDEGMSDMVLIHGQALILAEGSKTFTALSRGDLGDILVGLTALAYASLQALSGEQGDVLNASGDSHREYQLVAIMRQISAQIHLCSSGTAQSYSDLYHLCRALTSGFLNADFDKAFEAYHRWHLINALPDGTVTASKKPDLTDTLYE